MDDLPEMLVERGVLSAPDPVWDEAVRRASVIGRLAGVRVVGAESADAAATELGVARRQVYDYRTSADAVREILRYLAEDTTR